jgi:hypothetical protein
MATIEVIPGRYFSAVWFVAGEDRDLLIALFRDPGKPFELRYRFRYYEGESGEPHDGKDRKSPWACTCPGKSEDDVRALIEEVVAHTLVDFRARSGSFEPTVDVVELRGDDAEKNSYAIMARPWAHTKPTGKGGDA